jgi:hypothetical protein
MADGRESNGYFAKGNRFSRGNLGSKRVAELRGELLDATTADDVRAVSGKLLELAKAGDVHAAKVWLEFVIGKPRQQVELSGPDGGPLGVDMMWLTRVVLMALEGHPEVRLKVAEALNGPADVA